MFRLISAVLFLAHAALIAQAQTPAKRLEPTPAAHKDYQRHNDVAYLLSSDKTAILRYDLQAETWRLPLLLSEAAVSMWVDDQGIYVAFAHRVVRLPPEGGAEEHIRNFIRTISDVFTLGDFLYTFNDDYLTSTDRQGVLVADRDVSYNWQGIDVAPGIGKVFGRTKYVGPSDIQMIRLYPDGTLGDRRDSPYHGEYPEATRTFVVPGESRVIDNSGTAYNTADLSYALSVGGPFQHIDFYQDLPVLLRDGAYLGLSNAFVTTGTYTPAHEPFVFFIQDTHIFSFYDTEDGPAVEKIDLALLALPEPGQPVDPEGLPYTPSAVASDGTGGVWLLSPEYLSAFRWRDGAYTDSVSQPGVPDKIVVPDDGLPLISYRDGLVVKVVPGTPQQVQSVFVLPSRPDTFALVDRFIFTTYGSNSYLYNLDGTLATELGYNRPTQVTWDAARRRIYFVDGNSISWYTLDTDGGVVDSGFAYDSDVPLAVPLVLSPDGAHLLSGSGAIFTAEDPSYTNALSNGFSQAVWRNDGVFTLRAWDGGSQIQKWANGNYAPVGSALLAGTPLALYDQGDSLLVVTTTQDGPRFYQGNAQLQGFPDAQTARILSFTASPTEVVLGERVTLSWTTENATRVTLNGDQVASEGSLSVLPTTYSHFYRLTVEGLGGGAVADLEITVHPPLYDFGLAPPRFISEKNLWLTPDGDLEILCPDPSSDGANIDTGGRPDYYVVSILQECDTAADYLVVDDTASGWPQTLFIPERALPDGAYQIAISRGHDLNLYGDKTYRSDTLILPGPQDLPSATDPLRYPRAFQRWLLHVPRRAGGFNAVVRVRHAARTTDVPLSLVAFDADGHFLAVESLTVPAGQTLYRDLYGDGLFADHVDTVSHIAIYEPTDITEVALRYVSAASEFGAWAPETDLRRARATGAIVAMDGRTGQTSKDGIAVLNLINGAPVDAWLVYRDLASGSPLVEVRLGTVPAGGKLVTVASDLFAYQAGTGYTIETRNPLLRLSVLGLVFGGTEFFTTTPVEAR